MGALNKPAIHTHGEIFEMTSVGERKEKKKKQETVQNWKVTQVHCNYNTARLNCGLHSHNHNITVQWDEGKVKLF